MHPKHAHDHIGKTTMIQLCLILTFAFALLAFATLCCTLTSSNGFGLSIIDSGPLDHGTFCNICARSIDRVLKHDEFITDIDCLRVPRYSIKASLENNSSNHRRKPLELLQVKG